MMFTIAIEAVYIFLVSNPPLRQGCLIATFPRSEKRASGVARRVPEPFRRAAEWRIMFTGH